MRLKVLGYGETCINKNAFQNDTTSINIDEVEINGIMLFDKISYGNKGLFKYYTGYKHKGEAFPSPLSTKHPQLTGNSKHFDGDNKCINFLVNDKKLVI